MKKPGIAICLAAMLFCCTLWAGAEGTTLTQGEFASESIGFGGSIKVTLTVGESGLEDVQIEGSGETPEIGGKALETLREQLIQVGSADIDGVSGASVTSGAVKEAAVAAFALASGKAAAQAAPAVPEGVTLAENEFYGEDANGANGPITVKVTVEDGAIKDIKVLEQHETRGLGTTAILKMRDAMIKGNTTEVDSVAGATLSSGAFRRAVLQALQSAGQ